MANRSYIFLHFLIVLCIFSVSGTPVLVSIDCGSSDISYTDDNSIVWKGDEMGDERFMQQNDGESQAVQTSNSISHVMDTLRVFPSGKRKYCYSIRTTKGTKVLVRASFYYGNYDGKSSPPTFNLQFDGNDWGKVETLNDQVVFCEVIYVVKGDTINICLAQTDPSQFPFISALEVRELEATMYDYVDENYALFNKRRVAYGTNETIRYPSDPYDRIWQPISDGDGIIPVSSDALDADIDADSKDLPPKLVLQNAITTSNTSVLMRLSDEFPSFEVQAYVNMYFSEVTQLSSDEERSFNVLKGNETLTGPSSSDEERFGPYPLSLDDLSSDEKRDFSVLKGDGTLSGPISPPYGSFSELNINTTVSSTTSFFLVSTTDSSLPPLINALEIYYIRDAMTDGTDSKDLKGLASLQTAFDALSGWVGDPCLPAPYSWDWLNCNDDAVPRVTALNLSSFDLSGLLPDFSSMDSLETIDLQNNSLTGPIPDFLGTFPNLKQLNLADNQFSGSIPASLSNKNGPELVVTGNPDLCASGGSCQSTNSSGSESSRGPSGQPIATGGGNGKNKKSSSVPVILGTTIPAFILIWVIAGIFAIVHYNKKKTTDVVSAIPGQTGAGNQSPMPLLNPQMMGNGGQIPMKEIKVDMNQGNHWSNGSKQAGNGGRKAGADSRGGQSMPRNTQDQRNKFNYPPKLVREHPKFQS